MRPPILLVHGACSRATHMRPWAEHFRAAGYEVVAPSLPGHAPGDQALLGRLTVADYVAALREVHAGFDRPPVVIGHSMGGLLAQHLAATADCAAMVLVASVPPFALTARAEAIRYALPLAFPVLRGRRFRPDKNALVALALHDLSAAERNQLLVDFSAESGRAFRSMALGRAGVPASGVRCPVLVVSGGADRLIPQSVYRRIALHYEADQIIVPGRGHWLMAGSLVNIVAARVLAWIEAMTGRPDASPQASFRPDAAL